MKRSKTQQLVLDLMKEGWELGASTGIDRRCWLQKNGCGNGGEIKNVSAATVHALYKHGLIKRNNGFPWCTYTLIN